MTDVYKFVAGHDDLIHDLAYNFYGKRLATCSSDQKIKVFDMDDTGKWQLSDSWKAHDSSVLKISWAHPEFGQVIASCSFDRSIKVWEESEYEARSGGRRWIERAKLTDSRFIIQDVQFCAHHAGLKLGTVSADGRLRIYEAMDVVNLSSWTLQDDILISANIRESDGHYSLSWNYSRSRQPSLVVGCGKENVAKILKLDTSNKWVTVETLRGHTDIVLDVAWAPNLGRSYHLIATACKDHKVRIFKVTEDSYPQLGVDPLTGKPKKTLKAELIEELIHGAQVWSVEWNITGTLLSSSGDDGKIKIWKASYHGQWQCMSTISAEEKDETINR